MRVKLGLMLLLAVALAGASAGASAPATKAQEDQGIGLPGGSCRFFPVPYCWIIQRDDPAPMKLTSGEKGFLRWRNQDLLPADIPRARPEEVSLLLHGVELRGEEVEVAFRQFQSDWRSYGIAKLDWGPGTVVGH